MATDSTSGDTTGPRTVDTSGLFGASTSEILGRAAASIGKTTEEAAQSITQQSESDISAFIDKVASDAKAGLAKETNGFLANAFVTLWQTFAKEVYTVLNDFALAAGVAGAFDERGRWYGNIATRPTLLAVPELLELYRREPNLQAEAKEQFGKLGYADDLQDQLFRLAHPLLRENEVIDAWLRRLLSGEETKHKLGQLGWKESEINTKLELANRYPELNTLVVMWWFDLLTTDQLHEYARIHGWDSEFTDQVAEASQWIPSPVEALVNARHGAFNRQLIDKWGLHDLVPDEFIPEMKKKGLHRDTALQYWAGHWSPLSNAMATRLFQRNEFKREEAHEIFHLNGLAKGAWDLEIEAQYHVPEYFVLNAIVDDNPLDIQTITRMVRDMGYRPQDIPIIAQAYHSKENKSTKDNLQKQLEKQFKTGALSKSESEQALRNIGLTSSQIENVLQNVEVEVQIETMEETLKLVRHDYIEKYISEHEAVNQMLADGFTSRQVDYYIRFWKNERKLNRKRLTEAQIGHLYKHGKLTSQHAIQRWVQMGYDETDAKLLIEYYSL